MWAMDNFSLLQQFSIPKPGMLISDLVFLPAYFPNYSEQRRAKGYTLSAIILDDDCFGPVIHVCQTKQELLYCQVLQAAQLRI